jgi:hydroxylaminobenzene mutase
MTDEVFLNAINKLRKALALSGALLFSIGLFTGIWTAAALTGKVVVAIPHLALATHLNALLGGMWLILVSYTIEFLSYDLAQLKKLFWLSVIPAWANWFVTLMASFIGVNGLAFSENRNNNIIAVGLQTLVVLPSLIASIYWVRGFYKTEKTHAR